MHVSSAYHVFVERVELVRLLAVKGDAHFPRSRVHAEWGLEKMVLVLRNVNVQPWVDEGEDDGARGGDALVTALREARLELGPFLFGGEATVDAIWGPGGLEEGLVGLKVRGEVREKDFGALCASKHLLLSEDQVRKVRPQHFVVSALHEGRQRESNVAALAVIVARLDGAVIHQRGPRVVGKQPSALITHPAMDTTTARIYPEQMPEPKVLAEKLWE